MLLTTSAINNYTVLIASFLDFYITVEEKGVGILKWLLIYRSKRSFYNNKARVKAEDEFSFYTTMNFLKTKSIRQRKELLY